MKKNLDGEEDVIKVASTSAKVRNRWNKANYDRINLIVPKGNKDMIQTYAKGKGLTMSALINELLCKELGFSRCDWGFATDKETEIISEEVAE